jgi:hypothetical protein
MFFFLPFYKEFKPLNGTRQQHIYQQKTKDALAGYFSPSYDPKE